MPKERKPGPSGADRTPVYMTTQELAERWGVKWRTALRIMRSYRRTAVLTLSPSCVRIARAAVLDFERESRGCGARDQEEERAAVRDGR